MGMHGASINSDEPCKIAFSAPNSAVPPSVYIHLLNRKRNPEPYERRGPE